MHCHINNSTGYYLLNSMFNKDVIEFPAVFVRPNNVEAYNQKKYGLVLKIWHLMN